MVQEEALQFIKQYGDLKQEYIYNQERLLTSKLLAQRIA